MKKLIFLVISLFFFSTLVSANDEIGSVYADESERNFNLKVNAFGLLINLGDLTLEYKVSENMTFSGSFLIGQFNIKSGSLDFDINTVGGNLRANWYSSGAFSDSFYASIYGGHLKFNIKLNNASTDADLNFSTPYIGTLVGYGWFWEQLNVNLGVGYSHAFKDEEAEITVDGVVGKTTVRVHTKVAVEASIGWRF